MSDYLTDQFKTYLIYVIGGNQRIVTERIHTTKDKAVSYTKKLNDESRMQQFYIVKAVSFNALPALLML
jgi:hypothetical protein